MRPEDNRPESGDILDQTINSIRDEHIPPEVVESASRRAWDGIAAELGAPTHGIRSCADFQAMLPAHREGTLSRERSLLLQDHLRECVACRKLSMQMAGGQQPARPVRPAIAPVWRWAIAAALAAVAAGASLYLFDRFGPAPEGPAATVASADSQLFRVTSGAVEPLAVGAQLVAGETIRVAAGDGAVVRLRDGSMVELRERSDFSISETRRDVTIRLARGGVIVQAAHRDRGHLYVSTRDCRVAVTGTVFSVLGGVKGSRVSVAEGEVRVAQSGRESILHAGDQYSSSLNVASVAVAEDFAWSQNAEEYLALLKEFQTLANRLDNEVRMPDLRYSSELLGVAPAGTVVFVAVPNLGETLAQAKQVFQQQVQQSDVLREWWEQRSGARIEEMVDEMRLFASYLGPEVVIVAAQTAAGEIGEPVVLSTLIRDGFAEFATAELARLGEARARVYSSSAEIVPSVVPNELAIYIQGDKVAVSPGGGAGLREVAAAIEGAGATFVGSPFQQNIAAIYGEGAGMVFGADLERLSARAPQEIAAVGNVQNLVIGQKQVGDKPDTRAVVTFQGQRQGLFSLLADPAPIGALDYVSPEAMAVAAAVLNDPSESLDGMLARVPELSEGITEVEAELGINVRNDLAAAIGGEFAIAIDGPLVPVPSWKVALELRNPAGLEWTIRRVVEAANRLAAEHGQPGLTLAEESAGGRTWYTLNLPEGRQFSEIHFVFVDGYFLAAPSRALLERAIESRSTGISLVTSADFSAMVPRDRHTDFSAMAYNNVHDVLGTVAGSLGTEQREALASLSDAMEPALVVAYGDDDRITVASTAEAFAFTPSNLFGLRIPTLLNGLFPSPPQNEE